MKALTYHGPGMVRCEQVPDPKLRDTEDAIVEVELAAICGSDLHVYRGRETGLDHGTVMGHEFVGRIVAVGSQVRDLSPGDRVVSPFTTSCGRCFQCRSGLTARCPDGELFGWVQDGAGLRGAQAERVRVPLANGTLFRLPPDLPAEHGLLLADVLATGCHGVSLAESTAAKVGVIVGCGPIGLMAAAVACDLGGSRWFAIDAVPERLAMAERFGATPLQLGRDDVHAAVRVASEGRGADAAVEAVGSAEAGKLAFELLRPGGTMSIVGVNHDDRFPFSPAEAYDKNLVVRVGRCPVRALMPRLLPLVERRGAELAAIFTHRVSLDDGPEAYAMFDQRRDGCIKVALSL
ncbi:MAG TPA: alcohol dehydrogenase catalytic domain-containing protein [Candidatus Limnocylindria bacterium]|nr:alcohol dehydrogenase catalytic domain-containing protein [Candidatus Limnocylindria bacterium]